MNTSTMEDLSQEPLIVPGQTQNTTLFSDSAVGEADPQLSVALPAMSEESVLQQAELNNNNDNVNDTRRKRKGEDEGA